MKTEKNILIAFLLNLVFSVFEFIGGILCGSVAIISDAVHDACDALSIGLSFILERKSKKQPDCTYSYGYIRYSVIGGLITTLILLIGSMFVIYNSVIRILNPVKINYDYMICFAIIGVIVNFIAAYFTKGDNSINQKAVNLHMLEDVLGWIIVLIGAFVMKFTDFVVIDAILSIFVSVFILINAIKNLKKVTDLFLEKTPDNIDIYDIKDHILKIDGIIDVHHIHIWSMDGYINYATMHIVTDKEHAEIKKRIRDELKKHNICHVTLEMENPFEKCEYENCHIDHIGHNHHHHHHHHH